MYQVFVGTLAANMTLADSSLVLLDIWQCGLLLDLYRSWFHDVRTVTDLQQAEPVSERTVCFRKAITVPHTDYNDIGREFKAEKLQCAQSPLFQYFADSLLSAQRLPLRGDASSLSSSSLLLLPPPPPPNATAAVRDTQSVEIIGSDGQKRNVSVSNSTDIVAPIPRAAINITFIYRNDNSKLSGWSKGRYIAKDFFQGVVDTLNKHAEWTADAAAEQEHSILGHAVDWLVGQDKPAPPKVLYKFRTNPRIVAFEDLSIREQMAMARTSQILVGMHGECAVVL
jgi:hypothetical protein